MNDQHAVDALLPGLAEGREGAYAELYDRLGRRLFRAACGMLDSQDEAEDVVQEVFMSLYRARRSLANVRNLTAYVFTALRYAAIKRSRELRARQRRKETADAADQARQADPVSAARSAELEQALAALPPAQREVIVLKIDAELTFAQIGAALDISPNTAASRYRYALEKLRAALGKEP